ncbi:response regulator [Flavobacterium sp. UBA6135]|uniref:response regulator n=1 Tax=Flavobacterium sp. UBA6135 TaxID=1946553 RepID=UPI0025C303CE|nr:response regulator [Flavobacterium sp. UBA6135]
MKKQLFIVDDDQIYRMIVSLMLKRIDPTLHINECENGKLGLTRLQYLKDSVDSIIVLLDINMPHVDGWGFLEEIKKSNFYDIKKLTLYMVTSSTDERDIERASQYGFVKQLFHKPLSIENIKSIIAVT